MIKKTTFTLLLLSLSLTNCTPKKTETTADIAGEKVSVKKKNKYLKKTKRRKTALAQSNRPQARGNLAANQKNQVDVKVKTGNISHLLPNFKTEAMFNFTKDPFFPIVKNFYDQDIKLIIQPGDNQSLERANKQQLAHVENLAFNLKRLK